MERTEDEIRAQIAKAMTQQEKGGSRWPGMSYEEGVDAALSWVIGDRDEAPLDDE